jgi:hypothetical protein
VDFHADPGRDSSVSGRSGEFHWRARQLRIQAGWSLMHCIVGRNNLGDIEFLPGPGGGDVPGLVRQSLWFDKTSIAADGEPERLPYTTYDLPFTLPAARSGRVTR